MKRFFVLAVLCLSSAAVVADRSDLARNATSHPHRTYCAIDDPPPEPIDCPLCGGDPALHARRVIAVADVGRDVMAQLLRW